jgi:NAD(P)-dependent dehydrogenase (short-subunit alcohol dehydrogenase family)
VTDLAGKVVVITGGNSGIGKESAVALASMGAHVVIAARNPRKAAAAVAEVQGRTAAGARVETIPLDLASFDAVHCFAEAFRAEHDRCDVLLNNAGLVLHKRTVTEDGRETTLQVNHLGHFLLTHLLRDLLEEAAPSRVVNVASDAHKLTRALDCEDLDFARRHYGGFRAYCATKLMNVMFSRELSRRWPAGGVTANALHPGFVASNFAKEGDYGILGRAGTTLGRPFAISVAQGAETPVYLASSPDVEGITGGYFYKGLGIAPSKAALDDDAAARLWDVSAALTGLD